MATSIEYWTPQLYYRKVCVSVMLIDACKGDLSQALLLRTHVCDCNSQIHMPLAREIQWYQTSKSACSMCSECLLANQWLIRRAGPMVTNFYQVLFLSKHVALHINYLYEYNATAYRRCRGRNCQPKRISNSWCKLTETFITTAFHYYFPNHI